MSSDLNALLEAVCDEATFTRFVAALAKDWEEKGSLDDVESPWQNGTIGQFFESATEWATVSKNGLAMYDVPENPWKRAADILSAGKIYE